jgi:hypothetical protein
MATNGTTTQLLGTLTLVVSSSGNECGNCPTHVELRDVPFNVGRYPDSQLHLTNPCISGRHCIFTRQPWAASQLAEAPAQARGFYAVIADVSTNGCYVNARRIGRGKTAILKDGDEVQLVIAAASENSKYNITYKFQYPPLVSSDPLTTAAAVVGAAVEQTPIPLETAPAHASQYDAALINQSDIESDEDHVTTTPARVGEVRPIVRKDSAVKKRHINSSYDLDETNPLGAGSFATVYRAVHRATGRTVAIKQINKRRFALQSDHGGDGGTDKDAAQKRAEKDALRQQREVDILLSVRHPHVIRCFGVYETDDYLWFVLSFAAGGELFQMMKSYGAASDALVKRLVAQLVSAVHYLHSVGVVHRDIKLENLLLYRPLGDMPEDPTSEEYAEWLEGVHCQVSDFGLSRVLNTDTSVMSTMCGTPVYAAPEIIHTHLRVGGPEGYTPAVDLYSVGVVAYALFTGRPPYPYHKDAQGRTMKNRIDYTAKLRWPQLQPGVTGTDREALAPVSAEGRHCIEGLLAIDPRKRLSAVNCLAHPWLTGGSLAAWTAATGEGADAVPIGGKRPRARDDDETP